MLIVGEDIILPLVIAEENLHLRRRGAREVNIKPAAARNPRDGGFYVPYLTLSVVSAAPLCLESFNGCNGFPLTARLYKYKRVALISISGVCLLVALHSLEGINIFVLIFYFIYFVFIGGPIAGPCTAICKFLFKISIFVNTHCRIGYCEICSTCFYSRTCTGFTYDKSGSPPGCFNLDIIKCYITDKVKRV